MTSSSSHQRELHCIRMSYERTCSLDRLGIPRKSGASGFHTFRHSAASFINSQTGNLKLAQKLLGHATIDMTAKIYIHTTPEEERAVLLHWSEQFTVICSLICSLLGTTLVS